MVVVDGVTTFSTIQKIKNEIGREPSQQEIEDRLLKNKEGEIVLADVIFKYETGATRRGFYLDAYLKSNLDQYVTKAVLKKWDAVLLITGIEGSSKSTSSFTYAKYLDPTFPGELIKEGSTKRYCDRIVFTGNQLMQQIDKSTPGKAIVFDEAVLGFMAGDAGTEIQKILIKKMVTIRKKRLFIFIVIPSIFLLRMYMAVFRTRACIHFYSPDGLDRGYFKFYSYDTKRQLYIKGKKEFNQNAHPPDFKGRSTNTEGLFFNVAEYEAKKDAAIKELTNKDKKKKAEDKEELSITNMKYKIQRNRLISREHFLQTLKDSTWDTKKSVIHFQEKYNLTISGASINTIIKQDKQQEIEEMKDGELAKKYEEKVYNITEKFVEKKEEPKQEKKTEEQFKSDFKKLTKKNKVVL